MSEAELQAAVLALAKTLGWRVAHFRPAKTWQGWQTPVAADGKGWPDLVLVRGDRLIAAELKSATGRLTREQQDWLDALNGAGIAIRIWKPADWESGAIYEALRASTAAASAAGR